MNKLAVVAASLLLLASACKRSTPPAQDAAAGTPAAGSSASAAPAGGDGSATPTSPMAYVTLVSVLKIEPVDAGKVKKEDGKETSNFRALLYRGEQVTVLETREEWVRVRSSDEKEGWLKRSSVLDAPGVKEATFLATEKVFDRPDLLASNAKKKLDPGTFLLVVKEKAPVSEVNYSGGQNTWVLTERLASDPKDVGAAKLIEKARYLARNNKKEEALAALEIVRSIAPDSPLAAVLATELGVAPAAETPAPDASPQPAGGQDPLSPDGTESN